MPDVRIDANGLPKGPVHEWTTPIAHRAGVTVVDATDPASDATAVDTAGYECCRFDVEVTGSGFTSLTLQVLFWNPRQGKWFAGASRTLDSLGRHSISVPDARGAKLFLKAIAFTGTSFALSADACLS